MSEEPNGEQRTAVATQAQPEAPEVPPTNPPATAIGGAADGGHRVEAPTTASTVAPSAPVAAAPAPVSHAPSPTDNGGFDEFAASMAAGTTVPALKEGTVVRGVVVHIDREGVLVDVG